MHASVDAEHLEGVGAQHSLQLVRAHLLRHLFHDLMGVGPSRVLVLIIDFENDLTQTDDVSIRDTELIIEYAAIYAASHIAGRGFGDDRVQPGPSSVMEHLVDPLEYEGHPSDLTF